MERFCRRCAKEENTGEASAPRSAETPDTCAWCRKAIDSKSFANLRLCTSCSGLRFKCTKCSKSAQTPIFKPLSAFALERMLKCKEQRTLTNRACCLKCDDTTPDSTVNLLRWYCWKKTEYDCSQCLKKKRVNCLSRRLYTN